MPDQPQPLPQLIAAIQALVGDARHSEHLRAAMRHLGLWLIECADRADAAAGTSAGGAPAAASLTPMPAAPSDAPAPPGPAAGPADIRNGHVLAANQEPPRYIEARPIRGPTEVHIDPAVAAAALQRGLGAGAGAIASRPPQATDASFASSGGWSTETDVALPIPHLDFKLVESRCRLKAQGCEFAINRDRLMDSGESFDRFKPEYDALVARGKTLPDCFLWMVNPKVLATQPGVLSTIGTCYTTLADAAAMMQEFLEGRGEGNWPTEALWALAEAQSALYAALLSGPYMKADPDQLQCYGFVRDEARRRRLFMDRFLSHDAVADPATAGDLAARIAAMRENAVAERKHIKARKNALGKAEYHASKLAECAPDEREQNLAKIEEAVAVFLEHGGARQSATLIRIAREVMEMAEPFLPATSTLRTLVAEADARGAGGEDADDAPADTRAVSPEVLQAREILRGCVVLLVGGEERPLHARNLEQAFELRELRWAPHREHTSLAPMEHEIARSDVGLVLFPIRWNGTETGPIIRAWCKAYNKPCVTLKAGYNANQIAHAVLQQVSTRLATA